MTKPPETTMLIVRNNRPKLGPLLPTAERTARASPFADSKTGTSNDA